MNIYEFKDYVIGVKEEGTKLVENLNHCGNPQELLLEFIEKHKKHLINEALIGYSYMLNGKMEEDYSYYCDDIQNLDYDRSEMPEEELSENLKKEFDKKSKDLNKIYDTYPSLSYHEKKVTKDYYTDNNGVKNVIYLDSTQKTKTDVFFGNVKIEREEYSMLLYCEGKLYFVPTIHDVSEDFKEHRIINLFELSTLSNFDYQKIVDELVGSIAYTYKMNCTNMHWRSTMSKNTELIEYFETEKIWINNFIKELAA